MKHTKAEGAMNIIIVGCGKVGQNLAEQLNEQGNNVTIIDTHAELVEDITSRLDIMGVVGNGATHSAQQEAGIHKADLLIAVTGSDELNLLCCIIARKSSDCRTIARVKSPEYSVESDFLKEELDLAMIINPEYTTAEEISRLLRFPSAITIDTFAGGKVELLKFRLPEGSPLVGMSVKDMAINLHPDVLICTAERDEKVFIVKGDFVFEERDVISLVASHGAVADFFSKIHYKTKSVHDVIIAGGGKTGHYLCEMLTRDNVKVKIIEKDPAICADLSEKFPQATVIRGDAADRNTLLEEGLSRAGAFVALTNRDEENILLSLYAKSAGAGKIITKLKRFDFDEVVRHLELDATVYSKNITSDSIVRYVRAMKNTIGSNVETLYNVIKGKVEASEFIVKEDSPVVGIPLSGLTLKNNVLIAALLRGSKVIIPRGQDKLQPDDRVVVISEMFALHDISDVLK